jgi:GMP synthase-like glutamine amidotransferase
VGTLLYEESPAAQAGPLPDDLDMLIVMGGPMNVYDDADHPWLPKEMDLIRACIGAGKMVLGICLGAQLIAVALGGVVTRAPFQEIGWYPVELTEAGRRLEVFGDFPDRFTAFHWHGDTFSLPAGATHAAFSAAVPNQAFTFGQGRVVGLQFHLEETPESLAALVNAAGHELPVSASTAGAPLPEPWTSTRAQILAPDAPFDACRDLLFSLLDRMAGTEVVT